MGKTKEDTNARVAGRRKQTKKSAAEQMCMDNIPMDLNESDDSSVSDSTEELLYSFIREANLRLFTPRCIFTRSSLFSLFQTGPWSFPWSMFTYNLIELHLIRKMPGLTMLINWVEVSSQPIRGIYIGNIPTEVVSVDCIRVIGLSIKRKLLLPAIT